VAENSQSLQNSGTSTAMQNPVLTAVVVVVEVVIIIALVVVITLLARRLKNSHD